MLADQKGYFISKFLANVNFGVSRATLLLSGKDVYICGGSAPSPEMSRLVQVYNMDTLSCCTLDPAPMYDCEAVMIENRLTLLGGIDLNGRLTRKLATWCEHHWDELYPSMPHYCHRPGVLHHTDYLVVSGGDEKVGHFDIMKVSTRTWWTAEELRLPQPLLSHNLAVCGPYLYALGGTSAGEASPQVFSLPWNKVEKSKEYDCRRRKSVWGEVRKLPHVRSTPVPSSTLLLSVGGSDESSKPRSEILLLSPDSKKWAVVGHLQVPRIRPSVLPLSRTSFIVMCGSDSDKTLLRSVEFIQIA